MTENKIKVFESRQIRTSWNAEEEEWYFSVVDVVEVLTDSSDPKQYIKKLRSRDAALADKWGTICTPVEMTGLDGKRRKIQAANTKNILRIIQSIPSPKAEPFKLWLAQVGSERGPAFRFGSRPPFRRQLSAIGAKALDCFRPKCNRRCRNRHFSGRRSDHRRQHRRSPPSGRDKSFKGIIFPPDRRRPAERGKICLFFRRLFPCIVNIKWQNTKKFPLPY